MLTVCWPLAAAERSLAELGFEYDIYSDETYFEVQGLALKADVYRPHSDTVLPVLLYFHGGGWAYNTRASVQLKLLPWLQKGFVVINVDYRKVAEAPAPAAVVDARCALNWVRQQAARFQVDPQRIVLSGNSAGGHLALMAAYTSRQLLFDRPCWDGDGPAVAAVINWYGISDVADLMAGEHQRAYAVQWIGFSADPLALARMVSPLQYVSAHSSPTLSIHGDADTVVPYSQSLRLHAALTAQQVKNELITFRGKGHGDFAAAQIDESYQRIWRFLQAQKVMP